MSADHVDVTMLHCDQGMGQLIEIWDSLNRLTNIFLIDLGCDDGKQTAAANAPARVMKSLLQMKRDGKDPALDFLLISHQDFDHWGLLPDLLELIKKDLPATKLGGIYYGGTDWKPDAVQTVNDLKAYFNCNAVPVSGTGSGYLTPGTKLPLQVINNVDFLTLAVNAPCRRSAGDLVRNTTSAVMAVQFGGKTCVLPGDATCDTLSWINTYVYEAWEKAGAGNPTSECIALSVPHHGAIRTLASNYVTKGAKLDWAAIFAGNVVAKSIVASAGFESKHKHPAEDVMNTLAVAVDQDATEHNYIVYRNSSSTWIPEVDKTIGIYTTVTSMDPLRRTGWAFRLSSSGLVFFFLSDGPAVTLPTEAEGERFEIPRERYAARPRARR